MSTVLVFNLSARFDLQHFARTEAVDLFRYDSGVALFDADGGRKDDIPGIWPYWPKSADGRPKAIVDEIIEQIRLRKMSGYHSVLFIVDKPDDILPQTHGYEKAPARAVIKLLERINKQNQTISGYSINTFAICLSGHEDEQQRNAVIDYFDTNSGELDAMFFFESMFYTRFALRNTGTRFVLDLLTGLNRESDGADGVKAQLKEGYPFVINFNEPVPTVALAMRSDFSKHVNSKLAAGSKQTDREELESAEYKDLDQMIKDIDGSLRRIEDKIVEPIELKISNPDAKAPIYKTATLLRQMGQRATEYEIGLRTTVEEHIKEERRKQTALSSDTARDEEEIKQRIAGFSLPAMQFRWSLLQAIRSQLQPRLDEQVDEAQKSVTDLRKTLSSFFEVDDPKSREPQDNPRSSTVDLSQLQNVVSSNEYWRAHDRLIEATKRLPSRALSYGLYSLSFLAIWATAFCWTLGLSRGSSAAIPFWQYVTLSAPPTATGQPGFYLLAVALIAYIFACIGIAVAFSRIRKRTRVAHGRFIEAADRLERDFRNLAEKTLSYSTRARSLSLRKYFKVRLEEALDANRAQQFISASKRLSLERDEELALQGSTLQTTDLRAASVLSNEEKASDWVAIYFSESLKIKPGTLTVDFSTTGNKMILDDSIYLKDMEISVEALKDWEPTTWN